MRRGRNATMYSVLDVSTTCPVQRVFTFGFVFACSRVSVVLSYR